MRARDLWLEGIRHTRGRPNAHLLQSMAVLAGEMGLTKEARDWFSRATSMLGGNSHGIWQARPASALGPVRRAAPAPARRQLTCAAPCAHRARTDA